MKYNISNKKNYQMNKMPIDNQFINGKITIKNRNPSTEIKIQGQKIAKN